MASDPGSPHTGVCPTANPAPPGSQIAATLPRPITVVQPALALKGGATAPALYPFPEMPPAEKKRYPATAPLS